MGRVIDGLEAHEGYAARRRPDGTLTATWTATPNFDGYLAACGCGWTGAELHPATEAGYEAALDDWDANHAQPLLVTVVPPALRDALDRLASLLRADSADRRVLQERPAAAEQLSRRLRGLADTLAPSPRAAREIDGGTRRGVRR